MPAGDGTGPTGQGARTGRAAGYCSGFEAPGFANPAPGRGQGRGLGRGRGRGRGRGWRQGAYAGDVPGETQARPAPVPSQEAAALKEQVRAMDQALAGLRARIAELESAASAEDERA